MNRTRFLTSSLATVAVSAAITLAAPPANAADAAQQCGQPAVTVAHPAVPASFATEHFWTRTTPATSELSSWLTEKPADEPPFGPWTLSDSRTIVDVPAVPATTREETVVLEEAYDQQVIDVDEHYIHHDATYKDIQVVDQPAYDEIVVDKPAYDEVVTAPASDLPYAYVDKQGHVKYLSDPNWNGGADDTHDSGWNRTAALDKTITVHYDAVTHVVHHAATYKTETVIDQAAYDELVPATYKTVQVPAVLGTVTVDVPEVPAVTHDEFQYERVIPETVQSSWRVTSPGIDWVDSGQTRPGAMTDPGSDAWTETVTPATEPCPVDDGTDGVVTPPVSREEVLGQGQPAPVAPQAAPQAAVAAPHSVLPNTGSGASLGITLAGLGSLAAGAVLMLASRRRRFGLD